MPALSSSKNVSFYKAFFAVFTPKLSAYVTFWVSFPIDCSKNVAIKWKALRFYFIPTSEKNKFDWDVFKVCCKKRLSLTTMLFVWNILALDKPTVCGFYVISENEFFSSDYTYSYKTNIYLYRTNKKQTHRLITR